jgi:hypothetical protein
MLLKPQALRTGRAPMKRTGLALAPHPALEDGELQLHAFASRPATNPVHMDALPSADGHRLFEPLGIAPVIESGETIHDAIGRGEESQNTGACTAACRCRDRTIADRQWSGRKLNDIRRVRMLEVTACPLREADRCHGGTHIFRETSYDEIEVVRLICVFGVDRHDRAAGEDRFDARILEGCAHKRRELLNRGGISDLMDQGLPARRGRRRPRKYCFCSSSGRNSRAR